MPSQAVAQVNREVQGVGEMQGVSQNCYMYVSAFVTMVCPAMQFAVAGSACE